MKFNYTLKACVFLLFAVLNVVNVFAGDGSEANPYTIAEAIKVKDQNKTYWIKGYVVGEIEDYSNNKYFLGFEPPFVGRCNWLLSDVKDQTDLSKCMPIQIETGELCDTLNLDWNPKFWRKEVMVHGKFRSYYATWGLKFVEEIRILSPYPLEEEKPDPIDPTDPEDPEPPISDLPTYIFEDFNRIEKEQPNFDIGQELDRFTSQSGWYGQYVTTAKGKVRLGFESSKGWVQTPAANLSGNGGNYIVSFDAWDFGNDKEFQRINVYVHKGKDHIQTQEVLITNEQKNYTFKGKYGGDDVVFTFSAQKATKNRFYLDNVDIQTDAAAVIDPLAPYTEDFEDGLKELPVDFLTTYEEGPYIGANGVWNLVGAQLMEDDSAKRIGRKSVVIRLTENTEGTPGYIEMKQDKENGVEDVSFYAANYGSEKGAKIFVAYSTDKGKSWTNIVENVSLTSDITQYKYPVNVEGNVRIKIGKMDQTPMRACIDDILLTTFAPSSIEETAGDALKIKKSGDDYLVYTPEPVAITVYNAMGMIFDRRNSVEGWNPVKISGKGVFILKAGKQTAKIIVK